MKRKCFLSLLAAGVLFWLAGCGAKDEPPADADKESDKPKSAVELTVWGAQEDEELLRQIIDSFQSHYAGEADFRITFEAQGESGCKDALLADLEGGADVLTFADDQTAALAAAGALEPIEDDASVRSSNIPASIEAASVNGELYAYPLTADNGYFMYYNKEYFSKDDIKSFNRMTEAAALAGRKVSMDWSSAWYVYAFFGNTGLEVGLNEDGLTNYCTWNGTDGPVKGTDVAEAMLSIADSYGFVSQTDEEFLAGVQDGTVIAGVSGIWNAMAVEEAWGKNAGAAKLPVYDCAGQEIQMASFSGCKLVGVNAYSKHPKWADRLAQWISNEENQTLRFSLRGQGPSNINAANSEKVQASFAIAALLDQSQFSQLQRVGGKIWEPVAEFAGNMAQGNPSGASLQAQLDHMVEEVTAR